MPCCINQSCGLFYTQNKMIYIIGRHTEVTYSRPVVEGKGGELETPLSEKPVFAHPCYHAHFVKAVTPAARSCKPTCQPVWEDMVTQRCRLEVKTVKITPHICYSYSYLFRVFSTLHSCASSLQACIMVAQLCGCHTSQVLPWILSGCVLADCFPLSAPHPCVASYSLPLLLFHQCLLSPTAPYSSGIHHLP